MKKIFVVIAIAFCCSCSNKPVTSEEPTLNNDSIVEDTVVVVDSLVIDTIA